jgi:predicted homoserine dehydrogenase-like protein
MASEPAKRTSAQGGMNVSDHPHIDALIKSAGHIMIGAIKPVSNAAVAYDGQKAVAMLRYEADESVSSILTRLDMAIATAQASGKRVDEWNQSGAKWT